MPFVDFGGFGRPYFLGDWGLGVDNVGVLTELCAHSRTADNRPVYGDFGIAWVRLCKNLQIFQDNKNQLIDNQLKILAALEFLYSLTLPPIIKIAHMKVRLLLMTMFLVSNLSFGQRRYYERYDGPLPGGETVGEYLICAIGLANLGFILGKVAHPKEGSSESGFSTVLGLLAGFSFLGALLCSLPLFAWIEVIGGAIIGIGLIVVVGGGIIMVLYHWLKGN